MDNYPEDSSLSAISGLNSNKAVRTLNLNNISIMDHNYASPEVLAARFMQFIADLVRVNDTISTLTVCCLYNNYSSKWKGGFEVGMLNFAKALEAIKLFKGLI